jgi:hypothetical protein
MYKIDIKKESKVSLRDMKNYITLQKSEKIARVDKPILATSISTQGLVHTPIHFAVTGPMFTFLQGIIAHTRIMLHLFSVTSPITSGDWTFSVHGEAPVGNEIGLSTPSLISISTPDMVVT